MHHSAQKISAAFAFSFLITTVGIAPAHDGHEGEHKPVKVAAKELAAPTMMPDRVVLTWSADPTTTQSVTWRTSTQVEEAFAEIAVATPGPEFAKAAQKYKAESTALKTDINTAHFHSLVFKDLQPATKYAYRVGDGVNWSEWFQFRTASVQPEPFSFVY
ncbi:MAG: fibronectin type III domain-containing protein, partial [Planctomycetota bacterium]